MFGYNKEQRHVPIPEGGYEGFLNIILSERSKSKETEGKLMVAKVWREELEK